MRGLKYVVGTRTAALAILAAALFCGAANAQFTSYTNMLNTTMVASQSLFVAQTSVNKQREAMRVAAGETPYAPAPSTIQPPARLYAISATDFQPLSPPIMPDQFANSAAGVTPETRQEMRKLFVQTLIAFESKTRKNNLANAFAFITAVAVQIKSGKEPTSKEIDMLISYFNNTLAANPAYYSIDPQQKQILYESLVINGGIIAFLDAQGKQQNNPQLRTQAAQLSSAILKAFLGIDAK
ncbi:MAG: DUF6683 family protein [Acidobacteriota bacterium]